MQFLFFLKTLCTIIPPLNQSSSKKLPWHLCPWWVYVHLDPKLDVHISSWLQPVLVSCSSMWFVMNVQMGARWKVWKPDPHGLASLAPLKGRATVNQHKVCQGYHLYPIMKHSWSGEVFFRMTVPPSMGHKQSLNGSKEKTTCELICYSLCKHKTEYQRKLNWRFWMSQSSETINTRLVKFLKSLWNQGQGTLKFFWWHVVIISLKLIIFSFSFFLHNWK